MDTLKKTLKELHIYFLLHKLYTPIKKIKNRAKYDKHLNNLNKDLAANNGKRIFYIGIPTHNNLGDQAQYYCIRKFLTENYADYPVIEIVDDIIFMNYKNTLKLLKQHVNNDDIFVFQSGYRTTDVANFGGEYAHRTILKNFKNKVIVFPQTVNFSNKRALEKSASAYAQNDNYIFMARDKVSYDVAKKAYNSKRVLLCPDIVTSMIGAYDFYDVDKDGILLCLRNDAEKLYSDGQYNKLINDLKKINPKIDITDTNSGCNFEFDKSKVESEIMKKIKQFSRYKLIITDRYHGTIFGVISNAKVIVLNSTDHKLSSGVDWFKGRYDDYVSYCNNFDDVYGLAAEKYRQENKKISHAIFKEEFFDDLEKEI